MKIEYPKEEVIEGAGAHYAVTTRVKRQEGNSTKSPNSYWLYGDCFDAVGVHVAIGVDWTGAEGKVRAKYLTGEKKKRDQLEGGGEDKNFGRGALRQERKRKQMEAGS